MLQIDWSILLLWCESYSLSLIRSRLECSFLGDVTVQLLVRDDRTFFEVVISLDVKSKSLVMCGYTYNHISSRKDNDYTQLFPINEGSKPTKDGHNCG